MNYMLHLHSSIQKNMTPENKPKIKEATPPISPDAVHIVPESILAQMSPVYRRAYRKTRAVVDGKRIDMDEFDYSDVEADKIATRQRISGMNSLSKAEGEVESSVQAEILEAFLYTMINDCTWFGASSKAILPSLYDDIYSGCDLILSHTITHGIAYSGVSIDVTIGEEAFTKKIEDVMRRLRRGELAKVKYFKDTDGDYKGELNNLPRFVVGVPREMLFRLTDAWINNKNDSLKKDPIRKSILQIMIQQCDEFARVGNTNVARVYVKQRGILVDILKSLT